LEFDQVLSLADLVSTHNKCASVFSVLNLFVRAFLWQRKSNVHLLARGKHESTEINNALANQVLTLRIVVILHLEPKIDVANEDEPNAEVLDPLGVQVVVNHLCAVIVHISRMLQVRLTRPQRALRIGHREKVQVD